MERKENLKFISVSSVLGALLVVFGHSFLSGLDSIESYMFLIYDYIYMFHMPLFFFISGLLLVYTTKKDFNFISLCKKKISKLVIPYWFWTFVFAIPKSLVNKYGENFNLNLGFYLELLMYPTRNFLGHFWFIPTILNLFIIGAIVMKYHIPKYIYIILFFILYFLPIKTDVFAISKVCMFGIYFIAGMVSSDYIVNNHNKIFGISTFINTLIFSVIVFNMNQIYHNKLLHPVIAFLMIANILSIGVLYSNLGLKFLDFLFDKTMTIYLLSVPIQAFLGILGYKILNINWIVVMSIMFLSGVGFPIIVVLIYNKLKFKNNFFDIVLGIK